MSTALVPASLPPLYEVAGELMALLDTEALVTPEQEEDFKKELEFRLKTLASKTDHVGGFIKMLEYAELNTRAEVARMEERARTLRRASERLREYTAAIIQRIGRKLEGDKFTLSVRSCPASLEITNEGQIPDRFRNLQISIPFELWHVCIMAIVNHAKFKDGGLEEFTNIAKKAAITVSRERVREAIKAGEEVPGADLKLDGVSLVIR